MASEDYLPLTEVTYFILLSLAPEAKYGYAIMKDVQGLSNGRVNLSTSTLYGAIKRLLELGWIVRVEESENTGNNRERKSYTLTRNGRRVLEMEVQRLDSLVNAAQMRTVGNWS